MKTKKIPNKISPLPPVLGSQEKPIIIDSHALPKNMFSNYTHEQEHKS